MEKKESEACSWEEAALEFDQRLCSIWKRMDDLDSEDEFDEALNELDILEDEMGKLEMELDEAEIEEEEEDAENGGIYPHEIGLEELLKRLTSKQGEVLDNWELVMATHSSKTIPYDIKAKAEVRTEAQAETKVEVEVGQKSKQKMRQYRGKSWGEN